MPVPAGDGSFPATGRGRTTRRSGVSGDAPPISLFSLLREKRETGRARSKEKRERRGENLTFVKFRPKIRGLS